MKSRQKDPFALLDPQGAMDFLAGFPSGTRRKAEDFFRRGNVSALTPEEAGSLFSATVHDGGTDFVVELEFDAMDGWTGYCECPTGYGCEHIAAAMKALLIENSAASVRKLSDSTSRRSNSAVTGAAAVTGELARRLTAAVGRALEPEEAQYVNAVQRVFARCAKAGYVTHWDLQELGFAEKGSLMESGRLWPEFPADAFHFWLYLAHAAKQRQIAIPAFMEPVTDLREVEKSFARWERKRQVEAWSTRLRGSGFERLPPPVEIPETDLRLMFEDLRAVLQWRRSGQAGFEILRPTPLRQLDNSYQQGAVRFTPEADLLWHLLAGNWQYRAQGDIPYKDVYANQILGQLLRTSAIASRLVNQDGKPLEHDADELRWEMVHANGEEEDYRFRLVSGKSGSPVKTLAVFPGRPSLYLTRDAVLKGPRVQAHALDPLAENAIPAPALEQPEGIQLIRSLGMELPPRLRERVRTLKHSVVIHCELEFPYEGARNEECVFRVQAEAPDGDRQIWNGVGWNPESVRNPARGGKAKEKNAVFTVYDPAVLAEVPPLLAPLGLKPDYRGQDSRMRVTKKFPELFAGWLKTVPPHITVQLAGDLASFASTDVVGRVRLSVTEAEIDWFDLRVVLDVADTTLTQPEIKLLLNARGNYVRLEGKGWRRLQYDLSAEEDENLARLGLSPRQLSAEPQRLHTLQLADDAAKKLLPEQQVEAIQRRAGELKERVTPPVPAGVKADLRPYQVEGFHFLAYLSTNRFGGILADDMGLGKTLQTLAWLLWLRETTAKDSETLLPPTLVVCPKSVMDNWRAEAEKFTPELRVRVWSPSEISGFGAQLDRADVHVINYSQLRLMSEKLATTRWLAVILDEGQYIKNPGSQTAQVARSLRAQHRLILSGTPIENRLLDLWSLLGFAMPGVLGTRAEFGRVYDAKGDPFARRRLASRVRPFVLRRAKAQVAKDLPDRIEEDLFCELEGEQKSLYRAELKRAQQMLLSIQTQKELASQQFHFLTSLLRLRQICCHPRLLKPDCEAVGAKTEALLEQIEPLMEEGQKVLVFSQFVEMLELLRPVLEEKKWPLFMLTGETENRGDLVRRFQAAEGAAIFLISLKAGGFGLNLTAASYVILFDPWWNPAVENQAIDRTHRIGQTRKVIAYRLLIKDSIEEKIRELQKQKKALADDVLGEEKFSQGLTLDDLRYLFAD